MTGPDVLGSNPLSRSLRILAGLYDRHHEIPPLPLVLDVQTETELLLIIRHLEEDGFAYAQDITPQWHRVLVPEVFEIVHHREQT